MKNKYEVVNNEVRIFLNGKGVTHVTVIDLDDFHIADGFTGMWFASFSKTNKAFYVRGCTKRQGKRTNVQLHRLITESSNDKCVDHINHNTLDNRRSNLRVVTNLINTQNKKIEKSSNKTSGIRNVSWYSPSKKWIVKLKVNGENKHIGYFNDLEEAKEEAQKARELYFNIG